MFVNFVSLVEPKKIGKALKDSDRIKSVKDELHEFKWHDVWNMVPCPKGKTIFITRWIYHNKMDWLFEIKLGFLLLWLGWRQLEVFLLILLT